MHFKKGLDFLSKKTPILYRFIKWLVWVLYPKFKVEGLEKLPADATVIVGNHSQTNGPVFSELHLPINHQTWCRGEMMHLKETPSYMFKDFWGQKSRFTQPIYKAFAYLISPLAAFIFKHANTIAVYNDSRVMTTFKASVRYLTEGESIVIFPEHDVKYNNIIYDFQDNFIDLARLYCKKTGKALSFTPLYIARNLKTAYIGEPIYYSAESDKDTERARIKQYLMDNITSLAKSAPEHTVVPYRNIKKSTYPKNTD